MPDYITGQCHFSSINGTHTVHSFLTLSIMDFLLFRMIFTGTDCVVEMGKCTSSKHPRHFHSTNQSSCLFPIVLRVVSHKLHKNLRKENRNRKACTSKNSGSVFFWILFQHRELVKPDLSKALSHIPLYLMTNNIFLCLRLYTQNNWATQDTSGSLPILLE